MISKKEAHKIAVDFLSENKIEYEDIDIEAGFASKDLQIYPLSFGKYEGQKIDEYSVAFGVLWGMDVRTHFITIHAHTGEVLYITTPHRKIYVLEE